MTDLKKLSQQMKSDWDRRVSHDYRFWMSEAWNSDEEMWETGERDFKLLFEGVNEPQRKKICEVGCGVGRLLRPAIGKFQSIIGIDVSREAIARARQFLGTREDLELVLTDGVDLKFLPNASLDIVYSFAALTSIPAEIIARYLVESSRVLKVGGELRAQVYLGTPQLVAATDTLHLRCFPRDCFEKAVALCGFRVERLEELILPFKVSFEEIGVFAHLVTLVKESNPRAGSEEVLAQLVSEGGESKETIDSPSTLESWMTFNHARELLASGDPERAENLLRYALEISDVHAKDIRDLLDKITAQFSEGSFFESNLKILEERFPEVAKRISTSTSQGVEVRTTADGPTLWSGGLCFDHAEKPIEAAEVWAKRCIPDDRLTKLSNLIMVVGFGAGYHIEALIRRGALKLVVIEPSVAGLKAACERRDLREVFLSLSDLRVGYLPEEKVFRGCTELIIRPQTQSHNSDFCRELRKKFYAERGFRELHPSFGIIGPIQGGTLPITGYTQRALYSLRQRARMLDMSVFASGLHGVEEFTKNPLRKVALQNQYLEFVSQTILESSQEKPFDIVIAMAQAPLSPKVLSEYRAKGIVTALWFVEDYLRFTYWKEFAKYYDFIFTIQEGECLKELRNAGAGEVYYLSPGCDPIVHTPLSLTQEEKSRWGSQVSFVGAGYHNRQQVFAALAHYPFKIWGTEWPICRPFDRLVQEEGRRLTPEEYVKIFNATTININLHSSTERDGVDPTGDFINPRTFELASCGAFQLVDERRYLSKFFEVGKEIVTFRNVEELKQQINYFLEHEEERRAIAQRARDRVLKEHTYGHRLKEMLSYIYASQFEKLKSREDQRPWKRVIERAKSNTELQSRCQVAFERGEEPTLDALVSDIVTGQGKLTETEQKLLFLFHVRKQIIHMKTEEGGGKK